MKKVLSLILTLTLLVSMVCIGTIGASANDLSKTYDAAADGDLLYEAKFGETSGVYQPYIFGAGKEEHAKNLVVTPSADGTEVSFVPYSGSSGRVFYGGKVDGLTLGADKKYTIELEMKFPTGNAGFFFNIGSPVSYDPASTDGNKAMTADLEYYKFFGLYGQTKTEGACFTMSPAAGGKMPGEFVSDPTAYTNIPDAARVGNEVYTNVRVEIDGYFYAVYLNDALYDQTTINPSVVNDAPNLAITFYFYNPTATLSARNVKIYKGTRTGAVSVREDAANQLLVSYEAAKMGEKLYDFNFAATTGVYTPKKLQETTGKAPTTVTISDDGKSVTLTKGAGSGAAYYWGSNVHGLKISDTTKYTFTYKVKTVGKTAAGIGFNLSWPYTTDSTNATRLNFYGNFNDLSTTLGMKFANQGTNLEGQNYTDLAYDLFSPMVDADGFTDVVIELDGYNAALYIADATKNGELTLFRSVALTADNYKKADDVALWLYIYNGEREITLKDCSLYKGLTVSETYPDDPGTTETPIDPPSPSTGDFSFAVAVAVASVALISLAAVVVLRKKEN